MKWDQLTRRHFLQSTSGLCLSLPVLDSLLPKAKANEVSNQDKNFICFFKPNGCYPDHYFEGNLYGNTFKNRSIRSLSSDIKEISLKDHSDGGLSPIFGGDFINHFDDLNIYLGLSTKETNHNGAIPFATSKSWPSIDQVIAKSQMFDTLGRESIAVQSTKIGYKDNPTSINLINGKTVTSGAINDPVALFQILFSTQNQTLTKEQSDEDLKLLISEQKALDAVLEDANRLLKSRKLGSEDKKVLEEYLNFVRTKERQVSSYLNDGNINGNTSSTQIPAKPQSSVFNQPLQLIDTLCDLMVAAIKTNRHRIFNFQLASSVDETVFPLQNPNYTANAFHSGISHNLQNKNDHLIMDQYLFSKVVRVWEKLQTRVSSESDQLFADQTCMYVSGDIGAGEVPSNHTNHNSISFTFSGKNIPIKSGRAISYSKDPKTQGYPHNQLLIGLMEAMGVNDWKNIIQANGKSIGDGFGVYGGNQKPLSSFEKNSSLPNLFS